MSVGVGDFDADGRDDLFVTNDGVPNFLFRNVDGKRFEETALLAGVALPGFGRPVSSMGVAVQDVTGDGRPDLLVTALKGETFPLYVNDGGMAFHDGTHQARLAGPSSQRSGWGVSLVDLDNDGRPDIVTANSHVNDLVDQFEASSYKEPNSILLNRGNGFEDVTAQAGDAFGRTAAAHRGLVAADLDDDGRQDLVTTSLGGPVEVWRNGGPAGHWLRIVLRGRASNRDGLGATIAVGRPALLDDVSVWLRVFGPAGRARRTRVGHERAPHRGAVAVGAKAGRRRAGRGPDRGGHGTGGVMAGTSGGVVAEAGAAACDRFWYSARRTLARSGLPVRCIACANW